MKSLFLALSILLYLTSGAQTYYIVRHAEKETVIGENMMANDPPLSEAGKIRALVLKDSLKNKGIDQVFSTNTIRTRTTAEPISKLLKLEVQTYGPRPDAAFIDKLKQLKGNFLIVGHSNTVDDIVNGLVGEQVLSDLADSDYSYLFVVKLKEGRYVLDKRKYGIN